MQINRFQSNNHDINFGARLNIKGAKFDETTVAALSEKAKKIGLESDVIELNFESLFSVLGRNSYHTNQDRSLINYMFVQFSQIFNANFLSVGKNKNSEQVSKRLIGLSHDEIYKQQEHVANDYLDVLIKKYVN